ncbi:MAG: methyltransferase domain-containing protein [Actinobacteria bacterium]|nr:methyltransferase domain-containing protein [Actinomycetota bacterium]
MDATEWDARYAETELAWGVEPNRFLAPEVDGLEPGRALDLAAGEGRNALWLAEQGWTVTAVDFSSVGIDKARRIAAERKVDVTWIVHDVVTFEVEPGAFDLVIVFYLHIAPIDMKAVLAHATEALNQGGTLLIVGHDRANLASGVGGPQDPAILHDTEEITAELGALVIEKAQRVTRPVEGSERDAIDTLVKAVKP